MTIEGMAPVRPNKDEVEICRLVRYAIECCPGVGGVFLDEEVTPAGRFSVTFSFEGPQLEALLGICQPLVKGQFDIWTKHSVQIQLRKWTSFAENLWTADFSWIAEPTMFLGRLTQVSIPRLVDDIHEVLALRGAGKLATDHGTPSPIKEPEEGSVERERPDADSQGESGASS